jgi:hypothetical protein
MLVKGGHEAALEVLRISDVALWEPDKLGVVTYQVRWQGRAGRASV